MLSTVDVRRFARESGNARGLRVGTLFDAADGLGASVDLRLRWSGENLDRLLDAAHSALVEDLLTLLRGEGWEVAVEVSFSIYGERGSIDVLAFHGGTATLLVCEVKSVVPDAQALFSGLDRKVRLAPRVARDRGWAAESVAALVVVGDSGTARRRVANLETSFATAFPLRGWAVRRWLASPTGAVRALMFLPGARPGGVRRTGSSSRRVRRATSAQRSTA